MNTYIDQIGRKVSLPGVPERIVSLVPSLTELLSYLELDKEVIGITKFCVHPDQWFKTKAKIGGTKNIKIPLIQGLKPNLIIASKEENVQAQIEELSLLFPVYVCDVASLTDAIHMIRQIGQITGKPEKAEGLVFTLDHRFQSIRKVKNKTSCCYLIWKDPYMTVANDTFIGSMIESIGMRNTFGSHGRYPEITLEEINNSDCQLILLSSEPYPFNDKHRKALQQQLPDKRILLVDGEMFSWYGSRLLFSTEYFNELVEEINALL